MTFRIFLPLLLQTVVREKAPVPPLKSRYNPQVLQEER